MNMAIPNIEKLRFPIGKFEYDPNNLYLDTCIMTIETLPKKLKELVKGFSEEQLDTEYRPEGWTVRQVLHHLPDSHMNSYIRFKKGLTEDNPDISPYDEAAWAELSDTPNTPVQVSLDLLETLHQRWIILLKSLSAQDLERTVFHPEMKRKISLKELVVLYAWHSGHHYEHINQLKIRKGW